MSMGVLLFRHQKNTLLMTESKIQWEGWHQFTGMPDFTKFAMDNKDAAYNEIMWPTTDCQIIIWLN